jgi:leucyl-tRNA synthetase
MHGARQRVSRHRVKSQVKSRVDKDTYKVGLVDARLFNDTTESEDLHSSATLWPETVLLTMQVWIQHRLQTREQQPVAELSSA